MGFVWKEEFSHWLRSSFGHEECSRARPISNSQGYFQLMIHLCHLDAAPAQLPQFPIIANQRWNLALLKKTKSFQPKKKKRNKKFRPCKSRLSPPLFAADGVEEQRRAAAVLIGTADGALLHFAYYLLYPPSFNLLWSIVHVFSKSNMWPGALLDQTEKCPR